MQHALVHVRLNLSFPWAQVQVIPAQKQNLGVGAARLGTALLWEKKNQSSICSEHFCREELPEQARGWGHKPSLSRVTQAAHPTAPATGDAPAQSQPRMLGMAGGKSCYFYPGIKLQRLMLCEHIKGVSWRGHFTVLTALKCTRCDKDADVTGAISPGYLTQCRPQCPPRAVCGTQHLPEPGHVCSHLGTQPPPPFCRHLMEKFCWTWCSETGDKWLFLWNMHLLPRTPNSPPKTWMHV